MTNNKHRIAVYGNSRTELLYIEKILRKEETQVISSSDKKKFFSLLDDFNADLILLDLNLSNKDEYETLHKLRINPDHSSTPILLLTESGNDEEIQLGLDNGVTDIIIKPINEKILKLRVNTTIKAKRGYLKFNKLFTKMNSGFCLLEAIYDHDKVIDTKYLDLNPAYENLIGRSKRDTIGKTTLELMPGIELGWFDKFDEMFKIGKPIQFELHHAYTNRWYLVNSYPIGQSTFAVILNDITKKKENEEALILSEKRLSQAMSVGNFTMFDLDIETMTATVSDQYYEIVDISKETESHKIFDLWFSKIHPDDLKNVQTLLRKTMEDKGDHTSSIEHRYIHSKKGIIWLLTTGRIIDRNPDGSGGRQIGFIQDITKRKHQEELTKQSEEKLRLITDNIKEVIWRTDLEMNISYVSPSVFKLQGLTMEEIVEMKASERFTPESLEFSKRIIRTKLEQIKAGNLEGWKPETVEIEQIKKDKSTFWAQVSAQIIKDKNGEPSGIVGVTRDISTQRETESALIESEKRYRTLFENSTDPVSLIKDGKFVDCNNAVLNALEIKTKEEFCKLTPWDISPEFQPDRQASDQKAKSVLKKAYDTGYIDFDWLHLTSSGKNIWFHVSLTRIEIRKEIYIYVIWRDITKRKIANQIIKDSERRLKQIFKTSQVGIIRTKHREITFSNEYLCKMLGYSYDELEHKNVRLLYPSQEDYKYVGKKEFQILAKNGSVLLETRFKNKNGQILHVLLNSSFYNERDDDDGVISVITDVTHLKKIEESLSKSQLALIARNSEKDKFISMLSHDLGNQLSGSKKLLEMLDSEGPDWDQREKCFLLLKKNTQAAHRLLIDLVSWGKASLQKETYSPVRLNLIDSLEKAYKIHETQLLQKELYFKATSNSEENVFADPNMLDAIFRNLIKNAIKYTNKNGEIIIYATNKESMIEVCISDTGVGMTKEKADSLFSFSNIKSEPGTDGEMGSGLGLQIVKEYVATHGGQIWAESAPGRGTKVIFTLPIFVE